MWEINESVDFYFNTWRIAISFADWVSLIDNASKKAWNHLIDWIDYCQQMDIIDKNACNNCKIVLMKSYVTSMYIYISSVSFNVNANQKHTKTKPAKK